MQNVVFNVFHLAAVTSEFIFLQIDGTPILNTNEQIKLLMNQLSLRSYFRVSLLYFS